MSILTTRSRRRPGPFVAVNCPRCHAEAVWAESFEQHDQLGLCYIIPLLTIRNTFLTCGKCGRQLVSKVGIDEIATYAPAELDGHLAVRRSLISAFFALSSILLCWAPIVGLGLGVIGILSNLRSGGWPRTVSIVGTALSVPMTTIALIVVASTPA